MPEPLTAPFRTHNEIVWDGEVARCQTGPLHANTGGTVHGGLFATLLDAAMGGAVIAALPADQFAVTSSLTVNYLLPGRLGDLLEARAVIRRLGRTLAHVDGTLTRADSDETLATATGVFAIQRRP